MQRFEYNNIDQGIQILSNLPVGKPDKQGNYSDETFNQAVVRRLENFSLIMKELNADNQKNK